MYQLDATIYYDFILINSLYMFRTLSSWILTDKQCTWLHTNSVAPQPQHLGHNTTCGNEQPIYKNSWRWTCKCPKHVEAIYENKIIVNCCIKLVHLLTYYNIYLFLITTACLGQLTIIWPSLQNREQGTTQCRQYFCNMGSHKT